MQDALLFILSLVLRFDMRNCCTVDSLITYSGRWTLRAMGYEGVWVMGEYGLRRGMGYERVQSTSCGTIEPTPGRCISSGVGPRWLVRRKPDMPLHISAQPECTVRNTHGPHGVALRVVYTLGTRSETSHFIALSSASSVAKSFCGPGDDEKKRLLTDDGGKLSFGYTKVSSEISVKRGQRFEG